MRSMWAGSVAFGPVSVPVKMFKSIDEATGTGLRLICLEHQATVQQPRQCSAGGHPVAAEQLGRGIEANGAMVVIADDDLDALPLHTIHSIDVVAFVPPGEVPFRTITGMYYLEPVKHQGEKAYSLLRAALMKANKVGVARVGMREREQLCALSVNGHANVITLNTLAWPAAVRPPDDLRLPEGLLASPRELEMALAMVEMLSGHWTPQEYRDEYRQALDALITKKAAGEFVIGPKAPTKDATDLLAEMQAFVAAQKPRKGKGKVA